MSFCSVLRDLNGIPTGSRVRESMHHCTFATREALPLGSRYRAAPYPRTDGQV